MAEQSPTTTTTTTTSTPAHMAPQSNDPGHAPAAGDWEKSQDDANFTSETPTDLEKGSSSDEDVAAAAAAPAPEQRKDEFLVEFDGPNDPDNPKNWSPSRRWGITAAMGFMVFTVTFASSIFSVNLAVIRELFDIELVTATLGVALFVLVRWIPLPVLDCTQFNLCAG